LAADSLVGKIIHKDLLIKAKLGEGGMGAVYLGENAYVHDKKYAVKVVRRELTHNPDFQRQFFEEATHQSKLDHPNIVQMQNYFKEGDDYFLVLAYVDGPALSSIIDDRHGPLEEKQALSIIKDTLRALNCAHEHAIFHRDVKPPNILIDETGRARLTDFGIATTARLHGQSAKGRELGTAEYMSPEQIRDPLAIDHRADVYAAGVVLFEMLTGTLPFAGESRDAIKLQHLESPTPNPRTNNRKIPKSLAGIVMRAMEKDPDRRFQGCLQFLKAINSYEQRRRRLVLTLAAGVSLMAGAYIAYERIFPPPPQVTPEAIQTHVDAAIEKYKSLCEEVDKLHDGENRKRQAISLGDTQLIDKFTQFIADSEANMTKFATDYAEHIANLAKIDDRKAVRRILEQPKADPFRERFRRLADRDYERMASAHGPPSRETMLKECD
jgi:serine/threonine protein kinase